MIFGLEGYYEGIWQSRQAKGPGSQDCLDLKVNSGFFNYEDSKTLWWILSL
jgi:hypothetical protein